MTADELERLLADAAVPQRAKLDQLRAQTAAVRALDDAAFVRVVRAIKKKLASPKLADEVAALVRVVSSDRATRVTEAPRAEPVAVPWVGSADLDETAHAIEAAIAADPEAQGPYSVLGDYWSSIGDPRGELIAIGNALAKNPTHKAMRSAWANWIAAHPRALWGEHGITQHCLRDVEWYMGFIRACTVHADHRVDMPALVATLLDDPGPGRFVQRLVLDGPFALADVLARRPRPTLRTLAVGSSGANEGDLSALWPAVERLRELRCAGGGVTLGALRAPMLERFSFDFGYTQQPVDFLAPLWAGEGTPALRALALTNCSDGDALCEALVRSPLAERLTSIDFSSGTMTDAGAALLVEHRDKLARVERWDFELCYLSEAACAQLRTLSGVQELGDQRVADAGHRHGADWE